MSLPYLLTIYLLVYTQLTEFHVLELLQNILYLSSYYITNLNRCEYFRPYIIMHAAIISQVRLI